MSVYTASRNKSSHGPKRESVNRDNASNNLLSKTSGSFGVAGKSLTTKNTVCIGHSEIERMKENCLMSSDPEYERKMREKLELKDLSKQRVQNWPNTLHAIRKKKDESRFERFKKDEEERRRIDEEEALYMADVKRQVIDKANKQIYEGSDRVKTFQSKLLLVDTLQERSGQLELKQQMKEIEKDRQAFHFEQIKENVMRLEDIERTKQEELLHKKTLAQVVLREQHEEMKEKYIKRMQDEKIEGEIIKQRALELIAKEKEDEKMRRQKAVQTQLDTRKGNEVLKSIKAELREKEKHEEEKIKDYAEKKEKITEMRRMRENMRIKEKQDQRQKLIDEQVKRLNVMKSEEDKRINKQITEAQMKADESEKRKREALLEQKKRFDESIQLTLRRKEEQYLHSKQQDAAYQQFWINKNIEIHEKERQEKQDTFSRAKNLQEFHKSQADDKKKIREVQFLSELDEADKIKQRLENDDKNFNSWAERMIREWNNEGKDIRPLLKELTDYNKGV